MNCWCIARNVDIQSMQSLTCKRSQIFGKKKQQPIQMTSKRHGSVKSFKLETYCIQLKFCWNKDCLREIPIMLFTQRPDAFLQEFWIYRKSGIQKNYLSKTFQYIIMYYLRKILIYQEILFQKLRIYSFCSYLKEKQNVQFKKYTLNFGLAQTQCYWIYDNL